MTSNLNLVIDELVSIVREHFDRIANTNNIIILSSKSPNFSTMKPPLIAIYDVSFSSEQVGLGVGFGVSRQEKKDQFSGDGKQTTFKLSDEPVKPIVDVAIKQQQYAEDNRAHNITMNEHEDFKVDYKESIVIFRYPPQKGDNNVIIRYIVRRTTGETRALRLKIKCFVDLWSDDLMQCNMMTEETMKVLIDKEERLAALGININSPEGINLLNNGNINNSDSHNDANNVSSPDSGAGAATPAETTRTTAATISRPAFGRRLVYTAETYLKVLKEVPTIKKIEIREKGENEEDKAK
jgi:hypothetical protein